MDLPDGGAVVRAQRVERDLEQWGRRLYDALFSARENRDLLRNLLAKPEPRELTLATQDPVLLRLPWELMADGAGSLAQRVSVRRQLEKPETVCASGGRASAAHPLHRQPTGGCGLHRSTAHGQGALRCPRSPGLKRAGGFLPPTHPGAHGGDAARRAAGQGPLRPRSLRRARRLHATLGDRRTLL